MDDGRRVYEYVDVYVVVAQFDDGEITTAVFEHLGDAELAATCFKQERSWWQTQVTSVTIHPATLGLTWST